MDELDVLEEFDDDDWDPVILRHERLQQHTAHEEGTPEEATEERKEEDQHG